MNNTFLKRLYNDLENMSVLKRKASIEALKIMFNRAKNREEINILSKALLIAESFLNGDESIRKKLKEQLINC